MVLIQPAALALTQITLFCPWFIFIAHHEQSYNIEVQET
jgi:hypothetical protein